MVYHDAEWEENVSFEIALITRCCKGPASARWPLTSSCHPSTLVLSVCGRPVSRTAQYLTCLSDVTHPASHPRQRFLGAEVQDVSLCPALAVIHAA